MLLGKGGKGSKETSEEHKKSTHPSGATKAGPGTHATAGTHATGPHKSSEYPTVYISQSYVTIASCC